MSTEYFNYLNSRSLLGFLYRKYYLYPKLYKNLNGNILDIGCGVGDFLKVYNNAVGVDINIDCVNYCIKNGLNVRLMQQDKLPFDNNSFQSILLDNVLEHIEDPSNLLLEIKRVLKTDGILIIGVPCEKGYEFDSDHKIFYDIESLKNIFSLDYYLKTYFYTPPFTFFLKRHFRQIALYAVFKLQIK